MKGTAVELKTMGFQIPGHFMSVNVLVCVNVPAWIL